MASLPYNTAGSIPSRHGWRILFYPKYWKYPEYWKLNAVQATLAPHVVTPVLNPIVKGLVPGMNKASWRPRFIRPYDVTTVFRAARARSGALSYPGGQAPRGHGGAGLCPWRGRPNRLWPRSGDCRWVYRQGIRRWLLVMTLAGSRQQYAEGVADQTIATGQGGHRCAFEGFGAVPRRRIITPCARRAGNARLDAAWQRALRFADRRYRPIKAIRPKGLDQLHGSE